ncbi:MAG: hypothetical protein JW944_00660 [Deltaproteobacteria bacterium]|nr:hypothetical protein [Deltaproteobacteria bacterium]
MKFDRDTSREIIKQKNFEPNPRRLAAARRALKRERDKLPLFADQIAQKQPTPEERIAFYDQAILKMIQHMRQFDAYQWRKGRKMLKDLPVKEQKIFLHYWNNIWKGPRKGNYLCDLIRHWEGSIGRDLTCRELQC